MPPSTLPPQLIALLSSPQTTLDTVTDAVEEWILHRRAKGDTLFEVSVGLVELEDRTPPNLAYAFDRARYVTNVPQPTDLTPPMGPFPLARSASPATILQHLLSQPPPSIEHSREVILEYVLAREGKLKEKKSGRGGKGTLGREGFEDISKRLGEVEDGLKRASPTSPRQHSQPISASSSRDADPTPRSPTSTPLNENQQIGLTLILSLRMSLSYFTLQELADQLLLLALSDAERTLVQHIRRRVPGEGRWGIGKELEYVESLTLPHRPALRPAFRSARAKTQLAATPTYPIQLPAPSKSTCIKLISALTKENENGGPAAAATHIHSHFPSGVPTPSTPGFSPAADRSYFSSKRAVTASPATPASYANGSSQTPFAALPPLSPNRQKPRQTDPDILANYTMELVSEFLTKEKREHMLKNKWAKSGRDQLSKELGEIEAALCIASKNKASDLAQTLLPTFLLLRRTFSLPRSPLPPSVTEPYLDILPAPPDPDQLPFRELTVGTTTAALYVNPRLDDERAEEVLQELIDSERENVENAGGTHEESVDWLQGLIDSVQKRFPDGSYEVVFERLKNVVAQPSQLAAPSSPPLVSIGKVPSMHRRAKSSTVTTGSENGSPLSASLPTVGARQQHMRSLSLPQRQGTYDYEAELDSDSSSDAPQLPPVIQTRPKPVVQQISTHDLHLPSMLSPMESDDRRSSAGGSTSRGGWWDIVSAVGNDNAAPWHTPTKRESSAAGSPGSALLLPPGAEPAAIGVAIGYPEVSRLQLSPPTPPRNITASRRTTPNSTPGTGNRSYTVDLGSPPRQLYQPQSVDQSPSGRTSGIRAQTQTPEQRLPPPPLRFERTVSGNVNGAAMNRAENGSYGIGTPMGTISSPQSQTQLNTPQSAQQGQNTPSSTTIATVPTKSKLGMGTFSRSMSFSRNKKDKDKENNEKTFITKKDKEKEKSKVMNDPGRWNRDMVASIMGAPADRR